MLRIVRNDGTVEPVPAALLRGRTAPDPYHPYRKLLLTAERVRELSQLRPLRPIVDTLICWLCIVGAWVAVAFCPRWWVILPAMVVIGTRYYALFVIAHDALHGRLFKRLGVNNLFSDLFLVGPIGAITRINNQNHLRHHHHLASQTDPDRHKYGTFNKTSGLLLAGHLLGIRSVVRSVKHVFFPTSAERAAAGTLARRASEGTPKIGGDSPSLARRASAMVRPFLGPYSLRDVLILAAWQVGLLAGMAATIGWWGYIVLWWLPVYVFTLLGDNFRSFAEHSQPRPDEDADRDRLITFVSNPLERLLLAPMNMNFHAAHHLWPSIPYYNLPQADREMRASPYAGTLEWRGSYVGYLWRYYRALPIRSAAEAGERQSVSRAA